MGCQPDKDFNIPNTISILNKITFKILRVEYYKKQVCRQCQRQASMLSPGNWGKNQAWDAVERPLTNGLDQKRLLAYIVANTDEGLGNLFSFAAKITPWQWTQLVLKHTSNTISTCLQVIYYMAMFWLKKKSLTVRKYDLHIYLFMKGYCLRETGCCSGLPKGMEVPSRGDMQNILRGT